MPDKPGLTDELIRQNGAALANGPGPIIDRITQRQRRRLRWWVIATTVLWTLTALYLLVLLWSYLVFLHPVLHEFLTNPEYRQQDLQPHGYALIRTLKALLLWPIMLLLAAGCTIGFTLASRRATLRQIQASLAEISRQLKALGRGEA